MSLALRFIACLTIAIPLSVCAGLLVYGVGLLAGAPLWLATATGLWVGIDSGRGLVNVILPT